MSCSKCGGSGKEDCWGCHGTGWRGGSACTTCSSQGKLDCSCRRAVSAHTEASPFKGPTFIRVFIWLFSIASWIALMMLTQLYFPKGQAFAFWGGLVMVFVGSAFLEYFAEQIIAAMRKKGP